MPSRRALLLGGAAVIGGGPTAGALGSCAAGDAAPARSATSSSTAGSAGAATVPFHGPHQAGVDTLPAQAHARFIALDLRPGSGRDDVRRLLRLVTDDAARLAAGGSPLGADDPELAALPSRLTVTVGFGAGLFDAIGRPTECPDVVRRLPAFATDRLQDRWSGGDLLLQLCCDDPIPLSYATRRLVRDAREVATVRWVQRGFGPARGSEPVGTTARNLMGQRDGSANPAAGSAELARAVWVDGGPQWLRGGTMLVLRRIRMDLDTWDDLDRAARELAIARRLDTGAPLTGGGERDSPNPQATDSLGLSVLPPEAHVLRAKARTPAEKMLRRGYSYDDGPLPDGTPDAGLLFAAYQADPATAFVPVQRRLAESDALNRWTTHVGSAAFVVPPGCRSGEHLGQALLG